MGKNAQAQPERSNGEIVSKENSNAAYYKLFSKLKQANLLSKYSPKDIIEMSKAIYKIKVQNIWHKSEITQKTQQIFKKIGIDYLI